MKPGRRGANEPFYSWLISFGDCLMITFSIASNSYFRPLAELISRKFFKILRPRIRFNSWQNCNSPYLHSQRIRLIRLGGYEDPTTPSQTTNYGTRLQKLASRDELDRIRAFQIRLVCYVIVHFCIVLNTRRNVHFLRSR